jgi:hypothetical protein
MMNRSKSALLAALWLIAIVTAMVGVSCTGTNTNTSNTKSPTPTPDPCSTITDKEIVNNIYSELALVPELRTQLLKINIDVKTRVVTLWGWVLTNEQRTQVIDIAGRSKCVTPPVNADNFYYEGSLGSGNPIKPAPGGGCAPNYMRCGDICIPAGTGCGLEKQLTSGPAAMTKANANTAASMNTKADTNTKTNSNTGYSNPNKKAP